MAEATGLLIRPPSRASWVRIPHSPHSACQRTWVEGWLVSTTSSGFDSRQAQWSAMGYYDTRGREVR